MRESSFESLRKYIIKELIRGIRYDDVNHKLVFLRHPSLSNEKWESIIKVGNNLGIDQFEVERIFNNINFSTEEISDSKYQINSSENRVGTVYYFECREGARGNIACLEIMKMSEARMLVLKSDDKGLLPGDIILLRNTRFITDGRIEASVVGVSECEGKVFRTMPIKAIRIKSPSLVHEVIDLRLAPTFSALDTEKFQDETINVSNPVMGILIGCHISSSVKYLSIDKTNSKIAKDNKGKSYKSNSGIIEWNKINEAKCH